MKSHPEMVVEASALATWSQCLFIKIEAFPNGMALTLRDVTRTQSAVSLPYPQSEIAYFGTVGNSHGSIWLCPPPFPASP